MATVSLRAQDPVPAPATPVGQDAAVYALTSPDHSAATFRRVCVLCHPPDRIFDRRRTGAEWEETMMTMITKGAQGSEADFQTVFFFLVEQFGRVYINSAGADEIAAVLSLPPETGAAIVSYRDDQGPFADLDALSKVPGLDLKTITPESLIFQ